MASRISPYVDNTGLVFAYDLANVQRSYLGEPAYNRHDYDKSVMSQTGFNNWSCYDGNYTASYHTWNIAQSKTLVNIPGPDGEDTNVMLYHNFDGGFYGPTDWGGVPAAICTTGNKITLQAWVKAVDAGSVGKTVTPYMYFSLNAGGAEATSTNYTLTTDWQLVSHTHTMSANATNSNNILYFFTQNSGAVRMYLTKTAVLSGTGHAVQWLPGGQTRSATQGLKDLTGNSTIDLTNVSFDANAQMTFDGTNDGINLGTSSLFNQFTGDFTIDTWVRRLNAGPTWGNIIGDYYTNSTANALEWQIMMSNTGQLNVYNVTGGYIISPVASGFGANTWVNVVLSRVGSTLSLYANSSLIATATNTTTFGSSTGNVNIGVDGNSSSEPFAGDISVVRIYRRGLPASEIQQNFNAIKGRYGL